MVLPKDVVVCSYRLGGRDGVAVEAAKWIAALRGLGCEVKTVAGEGVCDETVEGLAQDHVHAPSRRAIREAFDGADLVVVENLCSLPLNPLAFAQVADALVSRPAILHHHDLAIERPNFAHFGPPPTDDAWLHVCVSRYARHLLNSEGIAAHVCYNAFETHPCLGDRSALRAALGMADDEILVLQPTRAIARKAVPVGLDLAQSIGAMYWLTGDVEDGYEETLHTVFEHARTRVVHQSVEDLGHTIEDAYGACDLVVLPSHWEGFGNPAIESAVFRRPLSIGDYPVAKELRSLGFSWHRADDPRSLATYVESFDESLASRNATIAQEHFSLDALHERLGVLLERSMAPRHSART